MIQKIHEKATELIGLLDEYESDLSAMGRDGSQVFMAWYRMNTAMSNIKKQLHYEETKAANRISKEDKGKVSS